MGNTIHLSLIGQLLLCCLRIRFKLFLHLEITLVQTELCQKHNGFFPPDSGRRDRLPDELAGVLVLVDWGSGRLQLSVKQTSFGFETFLQAFCKKFQATIFHHSATIPFYSIRGNIFSAMERRLSATEKGEYEPPRKARVRIQAPDSVPLLQ